MKLYKAIEDYLLAERPMFYKLSFSTEQPTRSQQQAYAIARDALAVAMKEDKATHPMTLEEAIAFFECSGDITSSDFPKAWAVIRAQIKIPRPSELPVSFGSHTHTGEVVDDGATNGGKYVATHVSMGAGVDPNCRVYDSEDLTQGDVGAATFDRDGGEGISYAVPKVTSGPCVVLDEPAAAAEPVNVSVTIAYDENGVAQGIPHVQV
jgi:hypothetical protein